MSDVFRTITVTAANRQAARDAITNARDEFGNQQPWADQGQSCFLGKRTTVQGGTVPTHYLMSGLIPEGMALLFAPGGAAAAITTDYSEQGWMDVCTRMGLYAVVEEI